MGFNAEPWFVPMKSFCDVCKDVRELGCVIHLFTFKVNNLGAGWTGPHTDYSYYLLLLCWIGESMCDFLLGSGESTMISPGHRMVFRSTFDRGNRCQA
jgi:hypothetical protein